MAGRRDALAPFWWCGFAALGLAWSSILVHAEIDPQRAAATIVLDETGVANLRLETTEAEEIDFEETVFVLGRIDVLPGKKAVVSSRIAGRAYSVLALPDQTVEEGEELMWVESRQPGDPPPIIKLEAPRSGIISKVNIALGQPVTPEQELIEIIDLDTVEAAAQVPQALAGRLAKEQTAYIRVPGVTEEVFEAKLAHLGAYADSDSGTIEAAFHVPNEEHRLRPGMRAEFSIVLAKHEGVTVVPKAALQGDAINRYVYVKDFDIPHAFVKTPVVVGRVNDRHAEILSGLLPADEVVVNGAYSLNFAGGGTMSLKEALDAAHGHEHNEDGSEITAEQKAAQAQSAEAHAHEAGGGGGWFWKLSTAVLLLLLVLQSLRPAPTVAPAHEKEEPAP